MRFMTWALCPAEYPDGAYSIGHVGHGPGDNFVRLQEDWWFTAPEGIGDDGVAPTKESDKDSENNRPWRWWQ